MTNIWHKMNAMDDPKDRCESQSALGACPYKKVHGSNYCPRHGGNVAVIAQKEANIRNYRLAKWQNRVNDFADNEKIKSLREEIGILRMTLEEMILKCKDSIDLLLYSSKISDLVMKIEKLVVSCDKLEGRMGLLLSKSSVIHLAMQYVEIITNNVSDPEVIERISEQMLDVTAKMQDPLSIEATK